jgi:hypothetical protein
MTLDYSGAHWRKSSRSGSQGGACVELAAVGAVIIAVRDSKHPDGPKLAFTPAEMSGFAARVKAGQLDL